VQLSALLIVLPGGEAIFSVATNKLASVVGTASAAVTFARGRDIGAFDAEIDRSLALVAEATDPQAKWTIVLQAAYLRLRAGDRVAAQQLLDESLETVRATKDNTIHYPAALLAASLELDPGEVAIPPLEVASAPLRGTSAALLEGDLLGAAGALAEIGRVSDEADVRLRAGKQLLAEGHLEEGKAQLERALAFYRGVRATRFVAEAETLLAEPHRQSA